MTRTNNELLEVGSDDVHEAEPEQPTSDSTKNISNASEKPPFDVLSYRPVVQAREWIVSEVDLDWIATGCYILGTGGGGSPYASMLRMKSILRAGGIVRVINPQDLKDDDLIGCGGGAGSPTVGIEKLQGDK